MPNWKKNNPNEFKYNVDFRHVPDASTFYAALCEIGFKLDMNDHFHPYKGKGKGTIQVSFQSGHHGKAALRVLNNFQLTEDVKLWARGSPNQEGIVDGARDPQNIVPSDDRISSVMHRAFQRDANLAVDLRAASREYEEAQAAEIRRQATGPAVDEP